MPREDCYFTQRLWGPLADEEDACANALNKALEDGDVEEAKKQFVELQRLQAINASYVSYEKLEAKTEIDNEGTSSRRFMKDRPLRELGAAMIWLGDPAKRDEGIQSKVVYSEIPRGNLVFGNGRKVIRAKITAWVRKADQQEFEATRPSQARTGAEDLDDEGGGDKVTDF